MNTELRVIPVTGIGEISPGSDLGAIIYDALHNQHLALQAGDILVVTQKIVSKTEGRTISLDEVEPSEFARSIAQQGEKDPQHVEVVLRETKRIVRMSHGVVISETNQGFICANAGVDESNVNGKRQLTLLPVDPDRSAQELRTRLQQLATQTANDALASSFAQAVSKEWPASERESIDLAIIISDTWGRPWRNGQVNMAIGVAGMESLIDYRGQYDPYGYELHASVIAVADELAAAAELVMGKIDRVPVALIRGYSYIPARGDAHSLIRDSATDMFR